MFASANGYTAIVHKLVLECDNIDEKDNVRRDPVIKLLSITFRLNSLSSDEEFQLINLLSFTIFIGFVINASFLSHIIAI